MTLSVQAKALADALTLLLGVVEKRNNVPVLSHVLLTLSSSMLTIRATDGDVEMIVAIDCEGSLPPTCVPAERLQSAAARLAERGAATLAISGSNLEISLGRSRLSLPTMQASDFPSLKPRETGCTFEIEGRRLSLLLSSCAVAMSNEETRYYLNGVYLFAGSIGDGDERRLCGVATNGHVLYARQVIADLPDDFPAVIVPRKSVSLLSKLTTEWTAVSVELSQTRMTASFGGITFSTKLVDATFPDWRRVYPRARACLSYDSKALLAAVAVASFASQKDKGLGGIKLTFGDEETELSLESRDRTLSSRDVCSHLTLEAPPDRELGLSHRYLIDIVTALDAETLEVGFSNAASPVVLTVAGADDRKAVIMPMRV